MYAIEYKLNEEITVNADDSKIEWLTTSTRILLL